MPRLSLHAFVPRSRANGPGERAVIWVQGCNRRCRGCFNPGTQDFSPKELVDTEILYNRVVTVEGIVGATFSGGEPFEQATGLAELARQLREVGLNVVCYTGYTLEQLRAAQRRDWDSLLAQVDLLIDGPYIESQKCHEPFRGSLNQQLHFLSGRIKQEEMETAVQTAEIKIDANGNITETGFPEMEDWDEVMKVAYALGAKVDRGSPTLW